MQSDEDHKADEIKDLNKKLSEWTEAQKKYVEQIVAWHNAQVDADTKENVEKKYKNELEHVTSELEKLKAKPSKQNGSKEDLKLTEQHVKLAEAQKAAQQEAVVAKSIAQEEAGKANAARNTAEQMAKEAESAQKVVKEHGAADNDITNKFTIKNNRDIYGQDIPLPDGELGFFTLSINACADKCYSSSSCAAFTFDKWKKKCFMKDRVVTSIIDARSVIGVKKDYELPNRSTQPYEIKIRHSSRFPGNPTASVNVVDFSACKNLCDEDKECVAFSFLKAQGIAENCELFHRSDDQYFYDTLADSGWKEQSP
jgi:hypothetical protein